MGEDPDWRGSSSTSSITSIPYFSLCLVFLLLQPTTAQFNQTELLLNGSNETAPNKTESKDITPSHNICGSIDIRNDARTVFNKENSDDSLSMYMNCTILEGTFSLSMITNSSTREEDFVTFPNLVEITGYLLVFNVKSLTTLSRIFPNLRVIGGSQLIMNYALIIYQNPDLKDVGLPNLRVIRNGGVRISENPSLCFVVNIDWKRLTFGQIDDVLVSDGESSGAKCSDECDDSASRCVHRPSEMGGPPIISCWNATTCQESCPFDRKNDTKELGSGCLIGSEDNEECHSQCIGGCYKKDHSGQCVACAGYLSEGRCVTHCPPGMLKYLSRCVTREECISSPDVRVDDEWRMYKPVNGYCVYDCPAGYEQVKRPRKLPDNTIREQEYCEVCNGSCPKKCKGKAIDTIAMAKDLAGCNIVEGTLDIQLRDSSKMTLLSDYLKDIEVIEGSLLIRFSPSLTSLSVFQKLREINPGKDLFQTRYALVIYENQNLNSLFSSEVTKKLRIIGDGQVQVQNNRMLCFKHISNLMTGLKMELNIDDQSSFSNGDKAICDETNLVISIEKMMSEGFILKWTPFNTSDIDHRKFLGYQVFYKRVSSPDLADVQIDQDRSVCSDTWSMHFEPEKEKEKKEDNGTASIQEEKKIVYNVENPSEAQLENAAHANKKTYNGVGPYVHAVITNELIIPNTFYAAYAQTKMVNHLGAKNARSNVIIVQTQYSNPTPPRILNIQPIGTDTLDVEWEEPLRTNGRITHYIVSWHKQHRDATFEVKHACDTAGERRKLPLVAPSTTLPPSTTYAQQSFMSTIAPQSADTCAASGCCSCKGPSSSISSLYGDEDEESNENMDRNHDFENAVQNIVFVPSCKYSHDPNRCGRFSVAERRAKSHNSTLLLNSTTSSPPHRSKRRRRRRLSPTTTMPTLYRMRDEGGYRIIQEEEKPRLVKRSIREGYDEETKEDGVDKVAIEDEKEEMEPIIEKDTGEIDTDEVSMPFSPGYLIPTSTDQHISLTMNTSSTERITKFRITNLTHATTYQVSVIACQDVDVDPHFCSLKPAYKSQVTGAIKENDMIPSESILTTVLNQTTSGAVFVRFDAPPQPNGIIHGFTVTVRNVNDPMATPISHCINTSIFAGGVIIRGLADGDYIPEIVTLTSQGGSTAVKGDQFTIRSPSFFTLQNIILVLLLLGVIIAVLAFVVMQTTQSLVGKRLGEYVRQTITANPEYLSQFDVYKQDEWELDRSSLTIGEEIGRGTFGKVYRGWGDKIQSQCGTIFSECAIKTVSEDANPAERLHFLIEASVMKQFNSSFIIHLYGVVSDGQPVLVVMEMMSKGNLRDYLRSRRPDAEENIHHLPVPDDVEIMEWAAQIADGMAYLEHLKFCHRDLAARNCMIGEDNVVKIGDFGMARDIYYHEYYKPTGKRMMPVRWMAPESLKDGKFSLKSDVWAYGIVLYEMMTLAQQPYQGLANDEVFNYIGVTRRVLERPLDCPDFWYELMQICWKYQPRERPTFRQIVELLFERASDDFRERSWVLNEAPIPLDEEERHEEIVDENAQGLFCMDNRRGKATDEYSDRGTELMQSEEDEDEHSV